MKYHLSKRVLSATLIGLVSIFVTSDASILSDAVTALEDHLPFAERKAQNGAHFCVFEGEKCEDDCECCGFVHPEQYPGYSSRCETRWESQGRRCYLCKWMGQSCEKNSDCCSQRCHENKCIGQNVFHKNPCYKSIVSSVTAVTGEMVDNDDVCPCTDLTSDEIFKGAVNAIDDSTSTEYTNSYPINSGLVYMTEGNDAPIRKIKVCTNKDCPKCDPTCYKLEGKCETEEVTDAWEFIQEGDLDLSLDRETCTEVPVVGRHQYTVYRVTFPCIRGSWECGNGFTASESKTSAPASKEKCSPKANALTTSKVYKADIGYNPRTGNTYFSYEFGTPVDKLVFSYQGDCDFLGYILKLRTSYRTGDTIKSSTPKIFADSPEPDTCVNGAEVSILDSDGVSMQKPKTWYFYIIEVNGKVETEMGAYGITSGDAVQVGEIEVPSCPIKPKVVCESYPMIVSEADLLGKCNEA